MLCTCPGPRRGTEHARTPAQVVFCNSVYSGALILGGLFVGDPWLGTCSAISLVVRLPTTTPRRSDAPRLS